VHVVSAFSPPSSVLCPLWPAVSTYSLWTLCTWWVQTQHVSHFTNWLIFTNSNYSAINYTAAHLRTDFIQMLLRITSNCWRVSHSPLLAGPTSLSFSQPRMHHSSGRLPDQHHGLWGVCPTYPSAPLLPSWVHLQLWNRRSEVSHLRRIIIHPLCAVCNDVWYLLY